MRNQHRGMATLHSNPKAGYGIRHTLYRESVSLMTGTASNMYRLHWYIYIGPHWCRSTTPLILGMTSGIPQLPCTSPNTIANTGTVCCSPKTRLPETQHDSHIEYVQTCCPSFLHFMSASYTFVKTSDEVAIPSIPPPKPPSLAPIPHVLLPILFPPRKGFNTHKEKASV